MSEDDGGAIGVSQADLERRSLTTRHMPLLAAPEICRHTGICVTYCTNPGQRRKGVRCPSCYGEVEIRAFGADEIEPGPTRAERFTAWAGGWVAAFCEAVMFPARVSRAHTEAMVRDLLQEAIGAGLRAEILTVCPVCEASEQAEITATEAGK
jgi:hypothetical protein